MTEKHNRLISFDKLVTTLQARGAVNRSVSALAGPPAAGKSTISRRLESALNALEPRSAAVLEMDGYHFDDWVLVPRNLRPRKGAAETFDVAGLAHMLRRLRTNDESEVAVPLFDRDLEIARAGAGLIPQSVRHLIVEGNYLLLNREPWKELAPLFDTTIFIVSDVNLLRDRLYARWRSYDLTKDEIKQKVHGNDLVNAELIMNYSRKAEFQIAGW